MEEISEEDETSRMETKMKLLIFVQTDLTLQQVGLGALVNGWK